MYPAQFEYHKAASVAEALRLTGEDADARIIAGGHSLLPLMKLRLARPSRLVDIGGLDELRGISAAGDALRIGALTTHREIAASPEVRERCGILAEAAGGVGDPAVRNRGTIGGNVCHADPASDLPTVLTALGAQFSLQGPGGVRTVAAGNFFQGAFTTALGGDEILTGVEVPALAANQVAEYAKMAHPATFFAVVGAAAVVTLQEESGAQNGRRCAAARIAVGGLTPRPVRAPSVEDALAGQPLTTESIAAAADQVDSDLGSDLIGDVFASADYRRAMAAIELKHALYHAVGLAHH